VTLRLLAPFCANGLHGVCPSPAARNDWNATETYERENYIVLGVSGKGEYSMTKGSREEKYEILRRKRIELEEIVKR